LARRRPGATALAALAWAAGTDPAVTQSAPAARAIYLSGHSLLNRSVADDLAALITASGVALVLGLQHRAGSSLRERASVAETSPDPLAGRAYDSLIVTEQNVLPAALLWNDTARELRRLHDGLVARNPQARTYFYEPWMSIDDKDDPSRWIAYERIAAPIWRCVAAAADSDLAASRPRGRVKALPAALALAELIAEAIEAPGIPGITQPTVRRTVDLLVADDVHPTRLGSYYLALVIYVAVTGHSPVGLWAPDGVRPVQARALQDFAARPLPETVSPDLDACAASLRAGAVAALWDYVERAHWRREHGFLAARWARLRQGAHWRLLLWRQPDWNPFRPG
jgi:hypothetical protein